MKRLAAVLTGFGIVLAAIVCGQGVYAQNYGAGAYGGCEYGTCSISVVSSGAVDISVIPTGTGVCTVAGDTVEVSTSSSTGYTLQAASLTTETALVDGGNQIAPTTGSAASPAVLDMNSWGFRVDSGAFGAGPTSSQSNAAMPAVTFAAMPANGSPATLAAPTSYRTPPDATTVWFGACANTQQPAGHYTGSVVYTALVNP